MAKKNNRRKQTTRVPRVNNINAKVPLSAPYFSHTRSSPVYRQEDRRNYTPEPNKLWKISAKKAKVTHKTPTQHKSNLMKFEINTFVDPKRALVCARRSIRKEIIFATGRQGSGNRKPRRTSTSNISCKG